MLSDDERIDAYIGRQVAVERWMVERLAAVQGEPEPEPEWCTVEHDEEWYVWVRPLIDWLDWLAADPTRLEFSDYPPPLPPRLRALEGEGELFNEVVRDGRPPNIRLVRFPNER
jgi:hypothetical protein